MVQSQPITLSFVTESAPRSSEGQNVIAQVSEMQPTEI